MITCSAICSKCGKLRPVFNDSYFNHSSSMTYHRCNLHVNPVCEACFKFPDFKVEPDPVAKPLPLIHFEELWTDPENGRKWLYRYGFCWDYETFKNMPDAVEHQGVTYVKSAYNSDSGTLAYRQRLNEVLAKPVKSNYTKTDNSRHGA